MLDKNQVTKMMKEMAALGAKYGVQVNLAGGTLNATDATIKFKVRALGESGAIVVTERAKTYGKFEGIDVNKKFEFMGKTHRIVDYRTRSKTTPWLTEGSDGKQYRWSTVRIKQLTSALGAPSASKVGRDALAHLIGA